MNLYDEISKVAYEIWLKKGMPAGNDMENWLEAEQIVYASLRQRDDESIESITYSVATASPLIDQPISSGTAAEKPVEKKKRGPYKKRKPAVEKKAAKKRDSSSKKTEKKPRTRKQKAE